MYKYTSPTLSHKSDEENTQSYSKVKLAISTVSLAHLKVESLTRPVRELQQIKQNKLTTYCTGVKFLPRLLGFMKM